MEASLCGIMFRPGYIDSLKESLDKNVTNLPSDGAVGEQPHPQGGAFFTSAEININQVRQRVKVLSWQSLLQVLNIVVVNVAIAIMSDPCFIATALITGGVIVAFGLSCMAYNFYKLHHHAKEVYAAYNKKLHPSDFDYDCNENLDYI